MDPWNIGIFMRLIFGYPVLLLSFCNTPEIQDKGEWLPHFGCCFGGDKKTGARYEQCEDDHHSGPMDDLRGGLSFEGWMDVSRPGYCPVALAAKLIINCSQSYFNAGFLSAIESYQRSTVFAVWLVHLKNGIYKLYIVHTIGSCQFCKKTSTSQLLDKMYDTHLNYVRICARS